MVDLEPLLIFFWSQFALAQQCNCARRRGKMHPVGMGSNTAWELDWWIIDQSLLVWVMAKKEKQMLQHLRANFHQVTGCSFPVIQCDPVPRKVSRCLPRRNRGVSRTWALLSNSPRIKADGPRNFRLRGLFQGALMWEAMDFVDFCGPLMSETHRLQFVHFRRRSILRGLWELRWGETAISHLTTIWRILGVSQFQFSHLEWKSTSWMPCTLAFLASGIPPSFLKKIQGLLLAGDEGRICTDGHLPWRRSLCPRGGFVQVGMGASPPVSRFGSIYDIYGDEFDEFRGQEVCLTPLWMELD